MMLRMSRIAAALVLVSAVAGTAEAQSGRLHLGPRVSYHFDLEEFGIGAQFGAPIGRYLEFYPSFDYFLVDPGTYWHLNADLKYRVSTESIDWLYLGAGLNLARASAGSNSDTNAGLNLFGGIESRSGRVHPFAEFRFIVNDGSTGMIAAGLNFTLGRP